MNDLNKQLTNSGAAGDLMQFDWRLTILLALLSMIIGVQSTLLFDRSSETATVDRNIVGKLESLTLDASRRTILVRQDGTFCSEPVPDSASTFAKEFATKLSGAVANEKAAANLKQVINTDVTKLFERSQGIQALRDGMYRLCEAFLNRAISMQSYQDHISDLTATLNFIVPLELCAKLNREIVVALATMPPVQVPDAEKVMQGGGNSNRPPEIRSGDPELAERQWRTEWAATITRSELLTSKFTQVCMNIGSEFASRLAGTMATRANARENGRASAEASLQIGTVIRPVEDPYATAPPITSSVHP